MRSDLAFDLLASLLSAYDNEQMRTPMIGLVCNLKDSIHLRIIPPPPPNLGTSGSSLFSYFRRACHCMSKLANVLQLMLAGVMDRLTWV